MSGAHKFEASDLAKFHSIPHIRPRLVERVRVCRIEHCIRTTDNQRAVCTELQPGGPRRSSRYCWRNPTLSRNTCSSYSGTGKILSTSPYVETSKAKSPSPLSAQESSPPCWKIRSQQTLGMFKKNFNRVLKYFKTRRPSSWSSISCSNKMSDSPGHFGMASRRVSASRSGGARSPTRPSLCPSLLCTSATSNDFVVALRLPPGSTDLFCLQNGARGINAVFPLPWGCFCRHAAQHGK